MWNPILHVAAAGLLSFSIGCVASGQAHGSASVSPPEMVFISSDVQVIADYDEPIFYTSNYYWRWDGSVWYRSSNYRSGWVRIETVPVAIRRIDRPAAYIHYRGEGHVNAQAAHEQREERKDAKEEQKEERKDAKEAQQEQRKDAKEAQQEQRKDAKEAQQEQRKDAKETQKEEHKDAKDDHKDGKPHKGH